MNSTYENFWRQFYSLDAEKYEKAKEKKFVHYTSAENAIKIIDGNSVWLRNARSMNDYSEIQHGIKLLNNFFGGNNQPEFWHVVESREAGLSDKIKNEFDSARDRIFTDTYIACVSEFDEAKFPNGRLSMWRAYAQNNGAALVLNQRAMLGTSGEIGANTFPVIYTDENDSSTRFNAFVEIVMQNQSDFLNLEPNQISRLLLEYFSTMTFLMKHKAFEEEQEWRIVYRPWWKSSDFLKHSVETVRGVPQPIYKFPLKDSQQFKIQGISLKDLIEKIIIGPSNDSYLIKFALIDVLRRNDFLNFQSRVFESNIPLRL